MRRHSAMEFVAGVMVFPGGGVDDRDRNADIAWSGPEPAVVGRASRRRTGSGRGAGVRGGPRDLRGVRRAVRRAGRRSRRHRRRRIGLPRVARGAGRTTRCRSPTSCAREKLVLRADLLRPWANWVTPKEERTRRYDTYFFVGALPEGQRADGDNTETDRAVVEHPAGGPRRFRARAHASCCRRRGRSSTRSMAAPSPRCLPSNVRSSPSTPHLAATKTRATGRSSSSTATATTPPATAARPTATADDAPLA